MTKGRLIEITRHQFELGTIFRNFDNLVRFRGTHNMAKEINLLHKLAFETSAKSFSHEELAECQTNFQNKLEDLRWVNGYNDCSQEDFLLIYDEWVQVVMELTDQFLLNGIYDHDTSTEMIEVNVGRNTDSFINLEVSIYERL